VTTVPGLAVSTIRRVENPAVELDRLPIDKQLAGSRQH
jgi:hypothetical protein